MLEESQCLVNGVLTVAKLMAIAAKTAPKARGLVNLGIALGSSVKIASTLNVDSRIMFTVGVAAQELGLIEGDYVFCIPLSATAKNIYLDRIWPPKK
ncbi:MAG: ferredoxin domain-containing protein [Zestosphaera sp.]